MRIVHIISDFYRLYVKDSYKDVKYENGKIKEPWYKEDELTKEEKEFFLNNVK